MALCLAVWFVAVATDAPLAHVCAMHHAGMHHAGMREAASHATPHAGGHHATAPDGNGAHRGVCTCLGHCCGATSVAPPALALAPAPDASAPTPPTPGRPHHEYVAAWVDFVLPFSTAPPTRVTA